MRTSPWQVLGDEGFRLFFPLCALYAAFWPLLWVVALGFDLPLTQEVPPSVWHAEEMIIGAWGAALIGFLTTAVPEWTDTPRLRGRALFALAGLWGMGRIMGMFGWERIGLWGALPDMLWLGAVLVYLFVVSIRARTDALLAFGFWLTLLTGFYVAARYAMTKGEIAHAQQALHLAGFAFLGLLGLALSRITVPVTNLVLDPSEETSPFRPHPGRRNLAPGVMLIAIGGEVAGLSDPVSGFLLCAAGAAFIDRLAEHFIGWSVLRSEILMLGGASALAGAGLLLLGSSRLGAPWGQTAGLHLALMGGLGLGVLAVLSIAGRLHADLPLRVPFLARLAAICVVLAVAFRIAPDLGWYLPATYQLASLFWGAGFVFWLIEYWPALRHLGIERKNHGRDISA